MSWTGNEKCHGSLRSENTSVCLDTSEHDLTRLQYHLSHVPKEWENQPLSSHAGNMLSPTPRFFSGGTFPLTKEKHRKSMTGKKTISPGDPLVLSSVPHQFSGEPVMGWSSKQFCTPGTTAKSLSHRAKWGKQRARRSTQKDTVPGAKNVGLYPQTAILTGKKDDD